MDKIQCKKTQQKVKIKYNEMHFTLNTFNSMCTWGDADVNEKKTVMSYFVVLSWSQE